MSKRAGVTDRGERHASPWQAVGLFVLLTAGLSTIFWTLISDPDA